MKTFKELGLNKDFISMLEEIGIKVPSEIQEKTIPLVLAGKDVIGGSATGSGKTLAFSSSIVENFEKNKKVQALILTPTRELAEQVSGSIAKFTKHKRLKVLSIYGGVDINNQIRKLRTADVVVGTPGRILDHLNRKTLDLSEVKFLVLDEVDRMFDMGFQFDVEKIIKRCPKERQTMLFSATIYEDIDYLASKYTNNPIKVSVESYLDASKLKQIFYDVPNSLKFSLIVNLLKKNDSNLVMIFCGTRRNVDFVVENLNRQNINAKAIHGGLNQNRRNKVLEEFNSKRGINVLVCTDVAARGLDIQGVSHVYNYDLPKTSGEYIHRIGRTARAGKDGIAISILSSRDYENFSNIERDNKLKIEKAELPLLKRVNFSTQNSRRETFRERSSDGRQESRSRFNRRDFRGRFNKRDSRWNKDSTERSSDGRQESRSRFNRRDFRVNKGSRRSSDGRQESRSRFNRRDSRPRRNSRSSGNRNIRRR
jgi:ATP-dependent RNA helicase DeaD